MVSPNSSNSEQELIITTEAVIDKSYKDDVVLFKELSSGQYATTTMFIPSNHVQQETKFQHNDKVVHEYAVLESYSWIPSLILSVMFLFFVSDIVWIVVLIYFSSFTGRAILKYFLKKHGLSANGGSSSSAARSETYLTSTGIRHIQPYDPNSINLSGGEIFIPYDQILSQQVLVKDCLGYEIATNIIHTKVPITKEVYVTNGCPSTSPYITFVANSKSITLFGLVEPYQFQKSIIDAKQLLSDGV